MKKCICFIGLSILLVQSAVAQGGFSDFIRYRDDLDDSKKLLEAYVSPFMKSATLGLASGWYNTAKTHKFVGFDLTTSVSFLSIPDKDLFYNVNDLGLKNFRLADEEHDDPEPSPDYPNAPTLVGPGRTPKFVYTGHGQEEQFDGPSGLALEDNLYVQKLPVPMVNVGISLPKDFDLKIRFAPTLKLGDDAKVKFWGIGVMHNIKQYFPGIKMVPFDLAAFVGHTQFEVNYNENTGTIPGENQRAEMKMSATTIQAVISKKLSLITFYGGVGYNICKSNIDVKGTYEVGDGNGGTDVLEDPIAMKFDSSSAKMTAGFRLMLAVISLHADYTFQKYDCINVGIGVSVH